MQIQNTIQIILTTLTLLQKASSASVNCNLTPSYPAPIVTNGWSAQLVAKGLTKPRGILFDSQGNLLVVQQGVGIIHLVFDDGGGTCLEISRKTYLVNSTSLNHGIALSNDEKNLYASSSSNVYSWTYDAKSPSLGTTNHTVITGMDSDGHTTRTLLMSEHQPGILLVSRGSNSNIDLEAEDIKTGHSQIKAFDLTNLTGTKTYDFNTEGRLLGWGLRNSVGVAEEPNTGGIYSVENSADQISRNDVDIHEDNPGEEMNFHGYLNSSIENQGGNYGYPQCFALWDTNIPDLGGLQVGSQFSLDQDKNVNDTFCGTRVAPRLTFQAHIAPLDIIFTDDGGEAYVSFHGSWNRDIPIGYKLSLIPFSNGSPTASPTNASSTQDIMTNKDMSKCPDSCFRPVGLAIDDKGRVFMSSDSTGEVWVVSRSSSSTGSSPSATSTPKKNSGIRMKVEGGWGRYWLLAVVVLGALMG